MVPLKRLEIRKKCFITTDFLLEINGLQLPKLDECFTTDLKLSTTSKNVQPKFTHKRLDHFSNK